MKLFTTVNPIQIETINRTRTWATEFPIARVPANICLVKGLIAMINAFAWVSVTRHNLFGTVHFARNARDVIVLYEYIKFLRGFPITRVNRRLGLYYKRYCLLTTKMATKSTAKKYRFQRHFSIYCSSLTSQRVLNELIFINEC